MRPGPLQDLDEGGVTFHTWDAEEGRLACVPHGPDPVLLGLRGRDPDLLRQAALSRLPLALGEPVDGWLLWATNQASGDHVTAVARLSETPEWGTVEVVAGVTGLTRSKAGGHRFVPLQDADGVAFEAAAFEPTKSLRRAVDGLRPGDAVAAVGAYAEGVLRLEKLRVDRLAAHRAKAANPVCPSCGRSMKSAGAGQGYRCRRCKTEAPCEAGGWRDEARTLALGWHEPPVGARRHLHRPATWDG